MTNNTTIKTEKVGSYWGWRAEDPDFDTAIMAMARRVWPDGYDVCDEAPSTFDELIADLDAGARLRVWSGGSSFTIYGSAEVNHAFRAWHDYHHWQGQHPFNLSGEAAVVEAMFRDLKLFYGNHPRLNAWRGFLYAEIIGQRLYFSLNENVFPNNQRRFVKGFLEALSGDEPLPCFVIEPPAPKAASRYLAEEGAS